MSLDRLVLLAIAACLTVAGLGLLTLRWLDAIDAARRVAEVRR